jgi:WD40 repeat protein
MPVTAVAWSPNGKRMPQQVQIKAQVDTSNGGLIFVNRSHQKVLAVAWSPDSRRIASGSR